MALQTCYYDSVMVVYVCLHMRLSRARVHDDYDIVFHALCNHLSLVASQLERVAGNRRKGFDVGIILHR